MAIKTILIEDDELIRNIYVDIFNSSGFEVEAFPDGKSALEALEHKDYELALIDIMLPDFNGLYILKTIKKSPMHVNTKCILLTNLGQDTIVKEAYSLKADGYLIKSAYNPDQLVFEIKKILASPGITLT